MSRRRRIGVTYLAAWLGVIEFAQLAAGETLLVIGVGGGVGSAAAQIGKWRGARVIGVDRHELPSESPAAAALDDFFSLEGKAFDEVLRRVTGGRGAAMVITWRITLYCQRTSLARRSCRSDEIDPKKIAGH